MTEQHTVEMLLLRPGIAADVEALEELATALPDGTEVGEPDESGVFDIRLEAKDQEDALRKVWDAVAASGADDYVVFLEHPALPEHWRPMSRRPGG
jgi:arginine/ornithine N-succinyltransferase beta subunit